MSDSVSSSAEAAHAEGVRQFLDIPLMSVDDRADLQYMPRQRLAKMQEGRAMQLKMAAEAAGFQERRAQD